MRHDLRALAHQLGGVVAGGGIICPGPGHSRLDRSLRVYPDHQAPLGFRVHSHAGDDWQTCQDHVADLLRVPRWQPQRRRENPIPTVAIARQSKADVDADERRRSSFALTLFKSAVPIPGTIAETYLTRRAGGIMDWPRALRFHPNCPRERERYPAIVAALRHAATNEFCGVQRIFLKPDGSDRLRDHQGKMTLGPATETVCKLSPDDTVTHALGIAEGIEKALALLRIGWRPLWATCGTSGMSSFPALGGVETLTVFADPDAAGQRSANQCAERWAAGGTVVKIVTPNMGGDWSDALVAA